MTTAGGGETARDLNEVLRQAGTHYLNQQYKQAHQLYGELAADPRFAAEGQYGLGMIALVHHNLGNAQDRLQDCVRRSPGHHRAMVGLGLVAERRGEVALARQWYADAARLGNESATRAVSRLDNVMAARAGAAPAADPPPAAGSSPPAAYPVSPGAPQAGQPDASSAPTLARQPSGRGVIGRVSALQSRQESRGPRMSPRLVVGFRLERPGQPPLPVEFRGEILKGSISPGDYVELPRKLARGRPVNAAMSDIRFWNLTTGGRVRVQYTAGTIIGIAIIGLIVGFVCAAGAALILS